MGEWVTRHNGLVATLCLLVMAGVGYGMTQVESSVQLMRLFAPKARIREDYRWLESHLGPLGPMEILVRLDQQDCSLNFLERMELVGGIQQEIGTLSEVGSSLSTVTFGRSLDAGGGGEGIGGAAARAFGLGSRTKRSVLNRRLTAHRQDFLDGDYLREATAENGREEELWRISARVSATKEVDYALFQAELRSKIDPILATLAERGVKGIRVDYTGLVPLVYKAQHSLLDGLIFGFVTDFAIIVAVMILLCRAASAGLVLLLPAAFPAIMVFGAMGWGNFLMKSFDAGTLLIDIGTVMAPSVALGVTLVPPRHRRRPRPQAGGDARLQGLRPSDVSELGRDRHRVVGLLAVAIWADPALWAYDAGHAHDCIGRKPRVVASAVVRSAGSDLQLERSANRTQQGKARGTPADHHRPGH